MGKLSLTVLRAIFYLYFGILVARNHAVVVDVKAKGAKGDGITDDGPVIMNAWKEACGGSPPSSVLFPPGTYMAFPPVTLSGPSKGPIEIKATGATIKAPSELAKFKTSSWIQIIFVDNLTMIGGTLDGQGQEAWRNNKCSDRQMTCQKPNNLGLGFVKNSLFKNVTSTNSKYFHITILGCDNTTLDHITIDAPANSSNTDGIHIGPLNGLNITNSVIKTGDDCISFGDGNNSEKLANNSEKTSKLH